MNRTDGPIVLSLKKAAGMTPNSVKHASYTRAPNNVTAPPMSNPMANHEFPLISNRDRKFQSLIDELRMNNLHPCEDAELKPKSNINAPPAIKDLPKHNQISACRYFNKGGLRWS